MCVGPGLASLNTPRRGRTSGLTQFQASAARMVQALLRAQCTPHPKAPHLANPGRLSWQAPSTGADKLLSFKLMVTNAEGRARVRRWWCACGGVDGEHQSAGLPRHAWIGVAVTPYASRRRLLTSLALPSVPRYTGSVRGPRDRLRSFRAGTRLPVCLLH